MDVVMSAILSLGLALVGFIISGVLIYTSHKSEIEKIPNEEERERLRTEMRQKMLVTIELPATGVLFAFAIFFLLSRRNLSDDLAFAISLNIGVSALLVALGIGLHVKLSVPDVMKNPEYWARMIVGLTLCEVGLLYSFAIAFLTMRSSGIMEDLVMANYLTMGASVGGLLAGVLMPKIEMENLGKRLAFGSPGFFIPMIGFLLAYMVIR